MTIALHIYHWRSTRSIASLSLFSISSMVPFNKIASYYILSYPDPTFYFLPVPFGKPFHNG